MHRREWFKRLGKPVLAVAPWGALAAWQNVVAQNAMGSNAMAERGAKNELAQVWQRERGVLLIRHASTEAGLGDPPGFRLGQCATQRNLSDQGLQESRAMAAWMVQHPFKPDAVKSSQWCRCQDTARLAFGQAEDWSALNSTFAGQGDAAAQLQALRARLLALPKGQTEVWVTHQVIMTGLTGAYPSMAEGFVVDRQGRLLARGPLMA